jgi:hypothetical protein
MAQQTAVDWLEEGLNTVLTHEQQMQVIGLFQQAKEMEKRQKKRAWVDGNGTQMCITSKDVDECFDDYYTQTYGK